MKALAITLAALGLATASAEAQLANSPPAPSWLSGATTVERSFEHEGKLLKAILLIASDAEVEIRLNDQLAGSAPAQEQAASVDVTRFIRPGSNTLRLSHAGSRVAALLELNGDLARKTWLATDAAWKPSASAALQVTAIDSATSPFDFKKTFDAYNSWQLAKPGAQAQATDPSSFVLPPGFKAELVRSALPEEGSWVAMTFDPQGRITLAREKRGLLSFDLKTQSMTVIEDTLLECRGLLHADGALFANANNSKGLYRLRDADGDGRYEEAKEILHTEGGVGHGRNHIKLGPDGCIYIAHGNNVLLPTSLVGSDAARLYANDHLIANPWDGSMFDGNVELPAGHVLKVKPDGSEVELVTGGLRNPLDIAFHRSGALLTFDADMERDVGTHWYVPTRVLQIVPGADYGWRRGTGRYPAWFADVLPSVADIGLSSPTGLFFGYGARFPERYREALYCCDWTYGRIVAVHLRAKGASFASEQETFVSGRPMNVTDGCIGPDGALWLITGGRGTQSGLYRISYTGEVSDDTAAPAIPMAKPLIASESAAHKALASEDSFERHAARMKLEARPESLTVDHLTEHTSGQLALSRWLVAVRSGYSELRDVAVAMAAAMPWDKASTQQRLDALRVISIGIARGGALHDSLPTFEPRFPTGDQHLDWELCKLLIHLKAPSIIAKATQRLQAATASEDLLFYPMHLRYLKDGWTLEQRRIVFEALNRAEKLNGASAYFKAIADTRAELAAALSPEEAMKLAAVIHPPKPVPLLPTAMPGHTFKEWTLADLEPRLAAVSKGRSFASAKAALVSSQCVFCHRVSGDASLPAGIVGPDLSQVSSRFARRDLLMHILQPSAFIDEKFRSTTVTISDGRTLIGALDSEDDERVVLKPNPLSPDVTEVAKAQIKTRAISEVSPMPAGLLNALKAEQILDLLAYFEAGGKEDHPCWSK